MYRLKSSSHGARPYILVLHLPIVMTNAAEHDSKQEEGAPTSFALHLKAAERTIQCADAFSAYY
jgi:hypothetical protein